MNMVQLHAGGVPSLFHGFAFLLQVLALALATAPANAGEYVIERGQDVAVCQAYRDNLNALKPNFAIQCGGRGVRAANPEISFPDWQPIETIEDYPELLPKIWDVLWKRDANPANFYSHLPNKDWHGTKRQKESAYRNYINVQDARGRIFGYSLALVDIDNDGKRETIYLDNPCSHESAILLVLNDDKTDIDKAKTALVMRHPSWRSEGRSVFREPYPGESLLDQPQNWLSGT